MIRRQASLLALVHCHVSRFDMPGELVRIEERRCQTPFIQLSLYFRQFLWIPCKLDRNALVVLGRRGDEYQVNLPHSTSSHTPCLQTSFQDRSRQAGQPTMHHSRSYEHHTATYRGTSRQDDALQGGLATPFEVRE